MCAKSSNFAAEIYMQNVSLILQAFEPISLSEMESVKLMNRIDTKYAVSRKVLPSILEAAQADYFVQEIDGDANLCTNTRVLPLPGPAATTIYFDSLSSIISHWRLESSPKSLLYLAGVMF